jgi:hypothetical protein
MKRRLVPVFAIPFLLALGAPLRAQEVPVEEATAATMPWSGWWWPAKTGHLVLGYRGEPGALVKHDQVSGKHAADWEQQALYHFAPAGEDWWGHCHAWAAASLLEQEPLHDVYQGGAVFHVGDIKGLLSEAHYNDHAAFYGQRFNGLPGDDFQDMAPLLVWEVLRKYIRDNQTGVIFDLSPGMDVDSHPAFHYRVTTQPADNDMYQGQLSLWVATYIVYPDYVGTAFQEHDYTFTFQAHDGQTVAGSDHWTGASLMDHPDFAWYPIERGQENPELDYDLVSQINVQAQ